MVDNSILPRKFLESYYEVQHDLDPIFDEGYVRLYQEVRDSLFPATKRGSTDFKNRAGDKF